MSTETVDDLFNASLAGDREDDAAWKSVTRLHYLGTREILEKAIALTRLDDPFNRARGADILGQLGVRTTADNIRFVPERLHALLELLRNETDLVALDAAIIALGHLRDPQGILAILPYRDHPDENIRYAVAWSLPGGVGENSEVIEALLHLMRDSDSDVRDWATFGLGTQSDADSPVIREAFAERLQDDDEDTRAEAAVGLAKRKDLHALPIILEELQAEEYGVLYEEAASYLLELEGVKPEGWDGWRYVEELRARFNIPEESASKLIQ
jgi:HEAT repeat protein